MNIEFSAPTRTPEAVVSDITHIIGRRAVLVIVHSKGPASISLKTRVTLDSLEKMFTGLDKSLVYYIDIYADIESYIFPWTYRPRARDISSIKLDGVKIMVKN